MQFSNHSGRAQRGGIVYLAVDAIAPSAVQPRQNFPPAQLEELSRSIAEYGVLSPLTVRPRPDGYELVAGERRHARGAQAALARNELVAAFRGLAHHERLDQAHLPDGLRKLRDAFLIKGDTRLVRTPVDGCNGDFRQLPAGVGRFCVLHKVEYGHRFVPPW